MAGSAVASRVHRASLTAELPDGWTMSESARLVSPSGIVVRVELDRVRSGSNSFDLAKQVEAVARSEVGGAETATASTLVLRGGRVAEQRRFECVRDGVASIVCIVCFVESGLGLTMSASWDASIDGADAEVRAVVAGVGVLSWPVVSVSRVGDAGVAVVSAKRAPVDLSSWVVLRAAWSTAKPVAAGVRGSTRWSPAELAVCATILGSPSFPTVGSDLLGLLPDVGLAATLDAVARSLLARRLVLPGGDGSTVLADELQPVMEVAVFPDLTILVERLGTEGNARWWFGLRPDSAVQVTVHADGSRECGELDPAEVIGHVLALTGVGEQAASHDPAHPVLERVTLDDVTGGATAVSALVRLSTSWRVGELIHAGVFTWAVGVDGSLWVAEFDSSERSPVWELRSTSFVGLLAQLLDHLPGG